MNKLPFILLTLAFIVSACAPAAEAPTSAPAGGDTGTSVVAMTAQVATLVLQTATPTESSLTAGSSTGVATVGGPVVITVVPANGTPKAAGTPLPAPTASPIPTLAAGLSPSELKYHVLAAYPNMFYCDPDQYPLAIGDETRLAEQRFPALQANQEEFQAILANIGLAGVNSFNTDQKLLIYQAHKKLAAIHFELMADKYQFQLQTKDPSTGKGLLITGLIDGQGIISAQQSQPSVATCPV